MRGLVVTLIGRPIAKKNSRRMFRSRGKGIVSYPSDAYVNWERVALAQLARCEHFVGPVAISYHFRFKGRMWVDADNAITGINDILERAGVVENDKLIVAGSFLITQGHPEWETELSIVKFEGGGGGNTYETP